MFTREIRQFTAVVALFFLCGTNALAQRVRGELRIEAHDAQGAAVSPSGELISEANGVWRSFVAGLEGRYVA